MADDPAFLFYYQDFLVGTSFMTLEERGAYITLLCHLADKNSISEDNICKTISRPIWEAICYKFKKDEKGFFNVRLRKEVEKRKKYTESRRNNLHMGVHMDRAMTAHMENENEDVNEDENKKEEKEESPLNQQVFNKWNERMPNKIKTLTKTRLRHLNERLQENGFMDNFDLILTKILASDFLMGRKPSVTYPNFKVSFDWIIANDNNYIKILEGKYDGKKSRGDV